jgi:hypothetical protein
MDPWNKINENENEMKYLGGMPTYVHTDMEQGTKFKTGKPSVFSVAYTTKSFAYFSGEVSI